MGFAGVYDGAGGVSAFTTSGTDQTERADRLQGLLTMTGSTQPGTGTVTSVWTATGGTADNSCGMVIPVNGITAGATYPVRLVNGGLLRGLVNGGLVG